MTANNVPAAEQAGPWSGKDQRFTTLPGIPARDDPELSVLMEAARRLPRDRADNCIESALRCALGYERTSEPEFVTRLARSILTTFRCRRNPEDQRALDNFGRADGEADPGEVPVWRHVAVLTAWLDSANPRTDHEIACRVMKLAEETGEVVNAYIGMTGQNPRKGTYATRDDVATELCDVVVTALVALATITGDADGAETRMQEHLSRRFARLTERIQTDPYRARPH
jgi:hypothetical protein